MSKRCYGCMKVKEGSPVCEHCGYSETASNETHQLPVGTALQGRYVVGKALGQGGFGITYIGWDKFLETPIAIKEYYPNHFVRRDCGVSTTVTCTGRNTEQLFRHNRDRFLREARILAKLSSVPGIVRVQNLFAENNTAYIAMEYVEGIDLKQFLHNRGRVLSVPEMLRILRPVLEALEKVHDAELVHRDISPDNIMILPDGSAKLLDFGAAREVADAAVDKELPQSTEAILKHGFAPMEQYRRRGNLGPWTDVYGLCATIYYCLTGKVPNSAPERITGDDNIDWYKVPGLTKRQASTLEQGMQLLPENRIRSMGELRFGLFPEEKKEVPKPAKKAETKSVKKAETRDYAPTMPVEQAKSKKKKSILPMIGAAAVLIAVGAGIFLWKGADKPQTSLQSSIEGNVTIPAEMAPVLSEEQIRYNEAADLEEAGEYGKAAIAFGKLGDYSDARERSFALWREITPRQTISASTSSGISIALKENGTIVLAGTCDARQNNAKQWTNIVSLSLGANHTVGLKHDGTVIADGANYHGKCDVSDWSDIVQIDAGGNSTVGLRSDGTVVAVGYSENGQLNVGDWQDIVAISASAHTVGLKKDGTVVAVGAEGHDYGQKNITDWADIVAVAAGNAYTVGLKSDGTVVISGAFIEPYVGVTDVTGSVALDWKDIVQISAGTNFFAGLKKDGTVVLAKNEYKTKLNEPDWADIVAISAGENHLIGLKSDGTVVLAGAGNEAVLKWSDIKLPNQTTDSKQAPQKIHNQASNVMMEDWEPTITTTGDAYNHYPKSNLLRSNIKRNKVKSVTFLDSLAAAPADAWDVSRDQDGSVLAWTGKSRVNNNYYDLYIGAEGGVKAPEYCSYLFSGYVNLREIHFGGCFDTSDTVSMQMMFHNCPSLEKVDTESLITSNVTDMNGMFLRCEGLTTLDLRNFDTAKVTDMGAMFWECWNLRSLNVSSFQTSNVTDMGHMFCACKSLTALDISNFDTSNVIYMGFMFSQCGNLTDLNLGEFDTSSVRDYQSFIHDGKLINGKPWKELFAN